MTSYIEPDPAQFEAFKKLPRDETIEMLNLIKCRAKADYPKDNPLHGKGLTGRQAYERYAEAAMPLLGKIGATIVWRGAFELTFIGPETESWDYGFTVHYPTAGAWLSMLVDPDYQSAVQHRQAAVETSRLVRFVPRAVDAPYD